MYTSPSFRRKRYYVNKRRFTRTIVCVAIILSLIFGIPSRIADKIFRSYYKISDFNSEQLLMYFSIGEQHNVPWYYLAAVDKAEGISEDEVAPERTGRIAVQLRGIERQGQIKEFLVDYRGNRDFFKRVNAEISKFKNIRRVYDNKVFPIARGYQYNYKDDFGGVRTYGGERTHEGIDIMCAEGVPIVSVCNGVVEKKGWLELGGWRLGIRGDDGMYYYYAHFSRYHKDIREGSRVKKGQVIGYAGDSGYGGEGTTGKFEPHLHFGMYEGREAVAVNPYPFLKKWERNKVDVKWQINQTAGLALA